MLHPLSLRIRETIPLLQQSEDFATAMPSFFQGPAEN